MRFLVPVLMMALSSCGRAPVTNRRTLELVPDGQMAAMGEEAFRDVLGKSKLSERRDWSEIVQRVGSRVAAAASGDATPWEIKLIDEPKTVNAFALPGGKIAVYTGMLPIAKNEAGLAAVIGHEVAHVTAKHGAERVSQTMLVQLGLTAAELSMDDPGQHQTLLALLGIGAQVGVLLPYSRLHESEADQIGLTYMAEAGYDPREAAALWDRMTEAEGASPPEFLSTHPSSESRAESLRHLEGQALALYDGSTQQASSPIPR